MIVFALGNVLYTAGLVLFIVGSGTQTVQISLLGLLFSVVGTYTLIADLRRDVFDPRRQR